MADSIEHAGSADVRDAQGEASTSYVGGSHLDEPWLFYVDDYKIVPKPNQAVF